MSKVDFTEEEIKRINRAAAGVESVSSGEVLTAVIKESSNYAFPELVFSLAGGFLYYLIMTFFHGGVERMIAGMFWSPAAWYITAFYGATTLAVIGILYVVSNIPGFDRLIVPRAIMSRNVYRRAMLHFAESGAANTKDRTGILFFISIRERMAFIIADEGINSKVEEGSWDRIMADIVGSIKTGDAAGGIERAVVECGEILKQHFPVQKDDVNELPDGIVFLED